MKQRQRLTHNTHPVLQPLHNYLSQLSLLVSDINLTLARLPETLHQPYDCAFPTSRAADGDYFTWLDSEVEVVEDRLSGSGRV
jgi:hypothetical protein